MLGTDTVKIERAWTTIDKRISGEGLGNPALEEVSHQTLNGPELGRPHDFIARFVHTKQEYPKRAYQHSTPIKDSLVPIIVSRIGQGGRHR